MIGNSAKIFFTAVRPTDFPINFQSSSFPAQFFCEKAILVQQQRCQTMIEIEMSKQIMAFTFSPSSNEMKRATFTVSHPNQMAFMMSLSLILISFPFSRLPQATAARKPRQM
jgi:hypothetical protein